jgi:hypothetical protein
MLVVQLSKKLQASNSTPSKPKGKKSLGRPGHGWEDNIKWLLNKRDRDMDWIFWYSFLLEAELTPGPCNVCMYKVWAIKLALAPRPLMIYCASPLTAAMIINVAALHIVLAHGSKPT